MAGDDTSLWFTYLLNPARLTADLANGPTVEELQPLLRDLVTNLLNNQNAGFFTDNPQELWFAKTRERKCLVLRNLSLQVAAYLSWSLATLESILPPPLLLYLLTALVQAQPDQSSPVQLANTASHLELDHFTLSQPGPTLQALTLLHRWVVRTFMAIRTPARQERSSTVMVPGVKRDPAILYRDQTHTLVSAVAPTSIKYLQGVLEKEVWPSLVPSHLSFPTTGTAIASETTYSVNSWSSETLVAADKDFFLATTAYDLGCCYFFCEDYVRARACFSKYFSLRRVNDPTLGGEVLPPKLAGYCACLGLDPGAQIEIQPNHDLATKLVETGYRAQHQGLVAVLSEDTIKKRGRGGDTSGRECIELSISNGQSRVNRDVVLNVAILNIITRSLRGLPLPLCARRLLSKLPPNSLALLETTITSLLTKANSREKRLIRCLVLDLIATDTISEKSKLASKAGLNSGEILKPKIPLLLPHSPSPSFLLLPAHMDKINNFNSSVQLLLATDPDKIAGLVTGLGGRHSRKVSSRWSVEPELCRSNQISDLVYILLAKEGQLRRLGDCFGQAKVLVEASLIDLHRSGSKDRVLGSQLEGEQLELDQLARAEMMRTSGDVGNVGEELLARAGACLAGDQACLPSLSLATSCLLLLVNSGDWEAVGRLSHANMPYILAARNSPHTVLFLLTRHLAFLMLNLRTNNHQMIKKFGRDVWDSMAHLVSSGAAKRQKEGGPSLLLRERALVSSFLCRIEHPGLLGLVLSLLASLHNVAKDDPNTDILSMNASVWPTGLATNSSLQERAAEEMLLTVLAQALSTYPQDPVMLRMQADLQYAASRYSAALALYLEAVAVRTDFFQLDCGPPTWLLEESVTGRMVICCRELGRLMQAVVLSQFSPDPNYAQAFKFLEDQTEDGSDSLYGCIWDMAILEFAMSLHTKRGEVARRRTAKHCIWQLELNTNNDEEILNEAANVRKAMFLRSLATQFF